MRAGISLGRESKMTKPTSHFLLVLAVISAAACEASAQTSKPTEPSFQELVKEVRLLRSEVRRFGTAVYKTQIMIEQTEVARLARGLGDVRGQLEETRSKQQKTRELLREMQKEVDSGVRSPRDLNGMTADLHPWRKVNSDGQKPRHSWQMNSWMRVQSSRNLRNS
jgi:hypothetical protein